MDPIVTIGIPSYNRASWLDGAIRSALNQTYKKIEIIVADNASTDATPEVCAEFSKAHSNFKVIRHESNYGATFNYVSALKGASGEYFMWLGDDDWLDPDYVELCLKEFAATPDTALVSGVALYYKQKKFIKTGRTFDLSSKNPWFRVWKYYRMVGDNGMFYGLYKTAQLSKVSLSPELGADWFTVSTIAFFGHTRVVWNTKVHREVGGNSEATSKVTKALGLSTWHTLFPYTSIAVGAARAIMNYEKITHLKVSRVKRAILAALVFVTIMIKGGVRAMKSFIPSPIRRRLQSWSASAANRAMLSR